MWRPQAAVTAMLGAIWSLNHQGSICGGPITSQAVVLGPNFSLWYDMTMKSIPEFYRLREETAASWLPLLQIVTDWSQKSNFLRVKP